MPNDPSLLTALLTKFLFVFQGGQQRLVGDALTLLQALAALEIALLGLWYCVTKQLDLVALLSKVLLIVGFGVLVVQWPLLTKTLAKGFVTAGLKAGGDAISETNFTDPGDIAQYGMSVTAVVFAHIRDYGFTDTLKNFPDVLFSGFAALAVVLSYFVLGIWVFIVTLEFYGAAALATILLPFGVCKWTAFLAEKAIASVAAYGVQLLFLAFILSAALPVLVGLQSGMNPDFAAVLRMLLGALTLLFLSWRAGRWAGAILQGAPQFTVQDVLAFSQRTITNTMAVGAQVLGGSAGITGAARSAYRTIRRRA
jgi:type IV secretion system protein TrbL